MRVPTVNDLTVIIVKQRDCKAVIGGREVKLEI